MKTKYLILIAIIVAFSSCSAAYQTGQTPDDVYYSPAPEPTNEYVVVNNSEDREIRSQMQSLRYRNNLSLSIGGGYGMYYPNGAYLNSSYYPGGYWPSFGNPYFYGFYQPMGFSYYSPSYYPYQGYYKGFYPPEFYGYDLRYGYQLPAPRPTNTGARTYNLGTYNNNAPRTPISGTYRGSDGTNYTPTQVPIRRFTPTQSAPPSANGVGGFIRRVFTPSTERRPSNSTPNRTFERNNDQRGNNPTPPTRTFTPTPPSPSSSNSGSAPVRTFRKD